MYKKKRVRVELLINSRTEYAGCNYISCVPYIMVVCEMVEKLPGSYSYNHLQDNLGCNTLDSLRMIDAEICKIEYSWWLQHRSEFEFCVRASWFRRQIILIVKKAGANIQSNHVYALRDSLGLIEKL